MSISIIGLAISLALLAWGRARRSLLVIPLIASNAFGATAVVTAAALGGASPLIYNVFCGVLILSALLTAEIRHDLVETLRQTWVPWGVCALIVYAVGSAALMPRLFAGQTTSFELSHDVGFVEVSLAPSSSNVMQTTYLVLFALTFFALVTLLLRHQPLDAVRKGFLTWAVLNAIGGIVDLGAKIAGFGDVLSVLRTANYAFLTDVEQAGFFRISGAYSEASAFGGAALSSLAFTYVYWRATGSRTMFLLSLTLLILTMLSTSSTAYLTLGVFSVPVLISLLRSGLRGRISSGDIVVVFTLVITLVAVIAVEVYDTHMLDPVQHLLQTTLFDKSQSESARERGYLNERSLHSLIDTWGLGIGYGSSRASSWFVAVVSQLGVVGAAIQALVLLPLLRRMPSSDGGAERGVAILHNALRACMLVMVATSVIAGTNANPGLLFFIALAGMVACRFRSPRWCRVRIDGRAKTGASRDATQSGVVGNLRAIERRSATMS